MKKFNFNKENLSHAIILASRGDLSSVSQEISKFFTCSEENAPCNQCNYCVKTKNNSNPDIITVDFLDKAITVDEIRKIRKDTFIMPNECKKKVYIIKNGQNMNIQAQNALLKTLEEPPSYVCFIIECTQEKKLLETIRSRCSIYNFIEENLEIDHEILQKSKKMILGIAENDDLSILDTKISSKIELLSVINVIKIFLRDSLILNQENCIDFEVCKKLCLSKNPYELYRIYDIFIEIEGLCEFNVSVINMLYYLITEYRIGEKNWQ